ncbi:hypothetical protein AK830_g4415 [Neonectria ditissima]|uniref:CBM-cenC domain-containing protein n=1 Tax=Neonectria ditissima TaxID=78410 RepID=A0A0N8H7L9_9HYPO|nr:hypothetical protein AK830_g4415 [Neonectria ditissima]
MHTAAFVLQLLALSYGVSAGPCRPQSNVSSSLTTETSPAETSSTGITETSATETSITGTSATETSSIEIAENSTTEISTTEAPTATSTTVTNDSTASTNEASTSSVPNYLQNPGFESGIAPWDLPYQNVIRPAITLDTSQLHSGSQSGYLAYTGPLLGSGFYGLADQTSLVAGQTYDASVWIRQSGSCPSFSFACALGQNLLIPESVVETSGTSVRDTWVQLKTSCAWTQAQINAGGVGIIVKTICASINLWVDDAVITPQLA